MANLTFTKIVSLSETGEHFGHSIYIEWWTLVLWIPGYELLFIFQFSGIFSVQWGFQKMVTKCFFQYVMFNKVEKKGNTISMKPDISLHMQNV